ncbi:uncharacterized protein LOC107828449 isoform X2 [Nicotiana tabacum]|uniref:Uncharacterized protein LOC107828449 isoform X2 n=1 Tax=Nicotiana tabacum TaxID=4097 RepID=A0A1S4DCS7_TOBAC|nr:PREDICTED: uncharacterized protein LOC107828449 isoform X3 [Nicotiana tabacum]
MENTSYSKLKKSFVIGIRSLLNSCSRKVITGLTKSIEDEFESLCEETQAGTTLNMVEELVEEQHLEESLNPLFLERSNTEEVMRHYLSEVKKDEISYLMAMLEKAEEQKRAVTSLLEALKKERHDSTDNEDRTRSLL